MRPQCSLTPLLSYATFSCSAVVGRVKELLWDVNGLQTSSTTYAEVLKERGMQWSYYEDDNEANLQLTVLASEENNETSIVCVALTNKLEVMKTPPVSLSVYGNCNIQDCDTNLYICTLQASRVLLSFSH